MSRCLTSIPICDRARAWRAFAAGLGVQLTLALVEKINGNSDVAAISMFSSLFGLAALCTESRGHTALYASSLFVAFIYVVTQTVIGKAEAAQNVHLISLVHSAYLGAWTVFAGSLSCVRSLTYLTIKERRVLSPTALSVEKSAAITASANLSLVRPTAGPSSWQEEAASTAIDIPAEHALHANAFSGASAECETDARLARCTHELNIHPEMIFRELGCGDKGSARGGDDSLVRPHGCMPNGNPEKLSNVGSVRCQCCHSLPTNAGQLDPNSLLHFAARGTNGTLSYITLSR